MNKSDPLLSMTDDEKLKALILTPDLPVAVLELPTLLRIGQWERIKGVSDEYAIRLNSIFHPDFNHFFDISSHIWVNPNWGGYKSAWKKAGVDPPHHGFHHLDHLHAQA